jgi:hypothetical protein
MSRHVHETHMEIVNLRMVAKPATCDCQGRGRHILGPYWIEVILQVCGKQSATPTPNLKNRRHVSASDDVIQQGVIVGQVAITRVDSCGFGFPIDGFPIPRPLAASEDPAHKIVEHGYPTGTHLRRQDQTSGCS